MGNLRCGFFRKLDLAWQCKWGFCITFLLKLRKEEWHLIVLFLKMRIEEALWNNFFWGEEGCIEFCCFVCFDEFQPHLQELMTYLFWESAATRRRILRLVVTLVLTKWGKCDATNLQELLRPFLPLPHFQKPPEWNHHQPVNLVLVLVLPFPSMIDRCQQLSEDLYKVFWV